MKGDDVCNQIVTEKFGGPPLLNLYSTIFLPCTTTQKKIQFQNSDKSHWFHRIFHKKTENVGWLYKLYFLCYTLLALRYPEPNSRFLTQTCEVHWLFDILTITFHCVCFLFVCFSFLNLMQCCYMVSILAVMSMYYSKISPFCWISPELVSCGRWKLQC